MELEVMNFKMYFYALKYFFLYFLGVGAGHDSLPFNISRIGKGTTGSDIC